MSRIVLACGCFDPLHEGHFNHLKLARNLGDVVYVALTSDEKVKKEKGPNRPAFSYGIRAAALLDTGLVNFVLPSDDILLVIRKIKPSVFVKGIDWIGHLPESTVRACEAVGASIAFTTSYKLSSTEILKANENRKARNACA